MSQMYEGGGKLEDPQSTSQSGRLKRYEMELTLSFRMDSHSPTVDDNDVLKQLIAKLKSVTKNRQELKSSVSCTEIRDRFSLDENDDSDIIDMPF